MPAAVLGRIRGRNEFAALYRRGARVRTGPLLAIVGPDGANALPAVAFAIRKEVGSAVVRNRLRRRLQGLLRGEIARLPNASIVIRPTPEAARLSYADLRRAVAALVASVGSVRPPTGNA